MGAAWLINLNLFSEWGIPVRSSEIAVTVTGIMIAGAVYLWRDLLGLFSGAVPASLPTRPKPWRRPSTCAGSPDQETKRTA